MQGNQNRPSEKQSGLSWTQPASEGKPASTSTSAGTSQSKTTSTSSGSSYGANLAAAGSTPRLAGTFVAGLIVGGLLTWMLISIQGDSPGLLTVGDENGTTTKNGAPSRIDTSTGVLGGGGTATTGQAITLSLAVADQSAGMQVNVSNVRVSHPTWVVVYDAVNGAPGRALAAKMFFPQNNGQGGVINLLRPTIAGQTYLVGGRIDNGDRQFDGATDEAVMSGGERILFEFKAQ